jgi:hypothetical protein
MIATALLLPGGEFQVPWDAWILTLDAVCVAEFAGVAAILGYVAFHRLRGTNFWLKVRLAMIVAIPLNLVLMAAASRAHVWGGIATI